MLLSSGGTQITQSHAKSARQVKFMCTSSSAFQNKHNFDISKLSYLSLTLILAQVDLFKHLRSLFHHQGLLVSVG